MIGSRMINLVCFSLITLPTVLSLNISGISSVRFANNSGIFPHGRDGVLEVKYINKWSAVCNFVFDSSAASAACFMLGYPPYGVAILNSKKSSMEPVLLSNFNCTNRINIGPNPPKRSSVHLGNCEFTSDIPSDCKHHTRDVSIVCLDPADMYVEATKATMIFAPVSCPIVSSTVRLVSGTNISGRVEVKHPDLNEWGTICADGFGVNEAKAICGMLCSSSDNLAYAHPLVGHFEEASPDEKIHLARISCPFGANSLNGCHLGGGWGSVKGCTHAMDVGVVCGPPLITTSPKLHQPNLTCDDTNAVVRFSKSENIDLTSDIIFLNGTKPEACQFDVVETIHEIIVNISLDLCGSTYGLSNETSLAKSVWLLIDNKSSNPPTLLPITCLLHRVDSVMSDLQASAVSILPEIVASNRIPVDLTFYDDRSLRFPIENPLNILPGKKIYARVALKGSSSSNSKLVVTTCWYTKRETDPIALRVYLIVDRCPVIRDVEISPISKTEVGFSFNTSHFGKSDLVNRKMQLFFGCDTRMCAPFESNAGCLQFCTKNKFPFKKL